MLVNIGPLVKLYLNVKRGHMFVKIQTVSNISLFKIFSIFVSVYSYIAIVASKIFE